MMQEETRIKLENLSLVLRTSIIALIPTLALTLGRVAIIVVPALLLFIGILQHKYVGRSEKSKRIAANLRPKDVVLMGFCVAIAALFAAWLSTRLFQAASLQPATAAAAFTGAGIAWLYVRDKDYDA